MKRYGHRLVLVTAFFMSLLLAACSNVNGATDAAYDGAPNFTLKALDGKDVNLNDTLKAKSVVLVFWATWCPYCVEEIPDVESFYRKNKDSVAVIGVNIKESRDKVASFAGKRGISYPVVLDTDGEVAQRYKVRGIPAVVAIGKNGDIVYSGHDINEMSRKVYSKQ